MTRRRRQGEDREYSVHRIEKLIEVRRSGDFWKVLCAAVGGFLLGYGTKSFLMLMSRAG